jgi:hypothetical protein
VRAEFNPTHFLTALCECLLFKKSSRQIFDSMHFEHLQLKKLKVEQIASFVSQAKNITNFSSMGIFWEIVQG